MEMEFICDKKDLQAGVAAVERIVSTRSTLPIIGYILFEAGKNGIKISANNLEIGIELSMKSKVVKEGAVLIPAKTLSGLVSKLPDGPVAFKLTEKGMLKISFDKSNFNVYTLPPDEFPVLPKIKEGKALTVDKEVFASMIRKTVFAVSSSEDKHVLNGVLIEVGKSPIGGDNSNLRLVATDGYRLAKRSEKVKLADDTKNGAIVPARAMQELLRLIDQDKEDGEIKILVSADQAAFRMGDTYLVSRLIQGQFPDYRQVLPKKTATKITVLSKSMLESAERAAVIAASSANIVRFEVKGGMLHLFASAPDVGTVDEVLEAEIKGESKAQIAFNIRLIVDVMKAIEKDKVVLELSESLGPGVVKGEGDEGYIYIVMPIRTQEAG